MASNIDGVELFINRANHDFGFYGIPIGLKHDDTKTDTKAFFTIKRFYVKRVDSKTGKTGYLDMKLLLSV